MVIIAERVRLFELRVRLPVLMLFLFNRRLRVSLTLPGLEGSGILGFATSLIASPLDLMFMTALVMTTALPVDLGSSLWLLVSESITMKNLKVTIANLGLT